MENVQPFRDAPVRGPKRGWRDSKGGAGGGSLSPGLIQGTLGAKKKKKLLNGGLLDKGTLG